MKHVGGQRDTTSPRFVHFMQFVHKMDTNITQVISRPTFLSMLQTLCFGSVTIS